MHAGDPEYIVCPMCLSALSVGPSALTCGACQHRFNYHKGIPILSTQMVPSCQPVVTDLSASLFSQLLASLPEHVEQTCQDFFMDFIQAVCRQGQASSKVLNMVDETKAVIKFLLDISPTSHVLNLGPGWDNTSINIARTTAKVTVLDLDLSGLCVLSLKKKYYGFDNIELIFGGDERYWPLRDQTFDAVIVQDSLLWSMITSTCTNAHTDRTPLSEKPLGQGKWAGGSHSAFNLLPALLAETKRVLKQAGSIFLGIRSYRNAREVESSYLKMTSWLDDDAIPSPIGGASIQRNLAAFKNRSRFESELKKTGFSLNKMYEIHTPRDVPESVVDVSTGSRPAGRFPWFGGIIKTLQDYQLTKDKSVIGFTAFGATPGQSWISGMLQDYFQSCDISPKAYSFSHMHVSRKGKVVILLRAVHTNKCGLVVKVPFHKNAQEMLENNHQTLEYLAGLQSSVRESELVGRVIPKCLHIGTYNGQTYFVEQGFDGVAWKSIGRTISDKVVWQQILTVLGYLNQIFTSAETPETLCQKYTQRLESIDALLDNIQKPERRGWEIVKDYINESLLNCSERLYFRKGDCSMHNVVVKSGKVTALIDFDEAGWTPFKTVDLADLLFSFARTRKKADRAAFIKMVMQENYDQMDLSIPMGECLDYLKADLTDFKISFLISWIDHVYHAIQFEAIRYRKYILKQSFAKTLAELEPIGSLFSR